MIVSNYSPQEQNPINWEIQHTFTEIAMKEVSASNFQDMFNLTRRSGEVEVKMNRVKFRAEGIGGMLGIAAGAMGGPLGSIIGFGIGKSVGSFVGNSLAKRYYGEEQMAINENLFLARQRDSQLKYQLSLHSGIGDLLETITSNKIKDEKKIIQDMLVL
jgi:hypothetical protein